LFFQEQSEHALMETVKEFERSRNGFRDSEMRANAERFRKERFHRELRAHVDSWWTEFRLQARRRGSDSETRLES
jgi:hypothetical protein